MTPAHILKNIRLLIRTRTSALIVILGPLLVMLLASFALQASSSPVPTVGFVGDNNLKETLSEQFSIVDVQTTQDCLELLRTGTLHACIQILSQNSKEVQVYVDTSKNIARSIVATVDTLLDDIQQQELTSSSNIFIQTLTEAQQQITVAQTQTLVNINQSVDSLLVLQRQAGSSANIISGAAPINLLTYEQTLQTAQRDYELAQNEVYIQLDDAIDALQDALGDPTVSTSSRNQLELSVKNINDSRNDIRSTLSNSAVQEAFSVFAQLLSEQKNTNAVVESSSNNAENIRNNIAQAEDELLFIQDQLSNVTQVLIQTNTLLSAQTGTTVQTIATPYTIQEYSIVQTSDLLKVVPIILCAIILFVAMLFSSIYIITEKKSPALFRNFASPISHIASTLGTFFTVMSILLIQIIIMLAIMFLIFNLSLLVVFKTLLVLGLIGVLFTTFGMIIGYFFSSQQNGTMGTITVCLIFIVFSDLLIPLESFPQAIANILPFSPFVLAVDVVRELLVLSITPSPLKLAILAGYTIISFLLVLGIDKMFRAVHMVYMERVQKQLDK